MLRLYQSHLESLYCHQSLDDFAESLTPMKQKTKGTAKSGEKKPRRKKKKNKKPKGAITCTDNVTSISDESNLRFEVRSELVPGKLSDSEESKESRVVCTAENDSFTGQL
jgi:hypothetical protein